jgi:ketosteroid isomerase-like protein
MERNTALPEWLDKLAIRDLLERYMRYNDDRAADRIADLFDEDAVFQVVGKVVEGRTAIREFFASPEVADPAPWTDAGELLKQPGSLHLCANPIIDIDGSTATSELDFQVVRRDEDGRVVTALIGRYRDRLRRRQDGRWVITSRTAVSVARPGEERTDAEWQRVLARMPEETQKRFRSQ